LRPPLISVITPTFNAEAAIERSLQNVISQDYKNVEHLFVDNCSSDNTVAQIRSCQQKYPHIRLLTGKDQGIYDAINKGMDHSIGDWLFFLGADDTFCHDHLLSDLVAEGWFDQETIVYGNVLIRGDAPWAKDGTVYDGPFPLEKLLQKNICHQAIFYPSSVKTKIGHYSLKYPVTADWDYNLHCYSRYRFTYVDKIMAVFRTGGKSSGEDPFSFYRDMPEKVIEYFTLDPADPTLLQNDSPFCEVFKRYLSHKPETQ